MIMSIYFNTYLISLKRSMEYRASFFLNIFSAIFPIIMQYYLWTAVYSSSEKMNFFGFSYHEMIFYTVLSSLLTLLVSTGFEREVADDIKNGGLNAYLVKPIGYFRYRIFCFLGSKAIYWGILSFIILFIIFFLSGIFDVPLYIGRICLFIGSLILSIVINFLIFFCLSTTAFWFSEIWGILGGATVLFTLFSGGLFPIDVFGEFINRILDYLPFKYIIYFPINILLGNYTDEVILKGGFVQLGWVVFLGIFSKSLWSFGTKKYVSVGG